MFENTVEKEAYDAFTFTYIKVCVPNGQTQSHLTECLKLWFPRNYSAKACIQFLENFQTNKKMKPEGYLAILYVNQVLDLFCKKGKLLEPPPEDWKVTLLG